MAQLTGSLNIEGSIIATSITGSLEWGSLNNIPSGIMSSSDGIVPGGTISSSAQVDLSLATGTAAVATRANNVDTTNSSFNSEQELLFVDGPGNSKVLKVDNNTLTYNSSTNRLTATKVNATELTGSLDWDSLENVPGGIMSSSVGFITNAQTSSLNVASATNSDTASYIAGGNVDGAVSQASSVYAHNYDSYNGNQRIAYVGGVNQHVSLRAETGFNYNPGQNRLLVNNVDATTLTGSLDWGSLDNVPNGLMSSSGVNDTTITLSAGTGLSGGGNFTTNQASNETLTFNVDSAPQADRIKVNTNVNDSTAYFAMMSGSGTHRDLVTNIAIRHAPNLNYQDAVDGTFDASGLYGSFRAIGTAGNTYNSFGNFTGSLSSEWSYKGALLRSGSEFYIGEGGSYIWNRLLHTGDNLISSSAQITLTDTTGNISGSRIIGDIQASSVDFDNVLNKPTLLSSSAQVNLGSAAGTAATATRATRVDSVASSTGTEQLVTFVPSAGNSQQVKVDSAFSFNSLNNILTVPNIEGTASIASALVGNPTLISSSAQVDLSQATGNITTADTASYITGSGVDGQVYSAQRSDYIGVGSYGSYSALTDIPFITGDYGNSQKRLSLDGYLQWHAGLNQLQVPNLLIKNGTISAYGGGTTGAENTLIVKEDVNIVDDASSLSNVLLGYYTGYALETGSRYNTVVGDRALHSNGIDPNAVMLNNVVMGYKAMYNGEGSANVAIGKEALENNTGGSNVAIGSNAGDGATLTGTANVFVGTQAGSTITGASNYNIALGRQSGPANASTLTGKLFIDTEKTDSPLIYGDFVGDSLTFNTTAGGTVISGSLDVTGAITGDVDWDNLSNVPNGLMSSSDGAVSSSTQIASLLNADRPDISLYNSSGEAASGDITAWNATFQNLRVEQNFENLPFELVATSTTRPARMQSNRLQLRTAQGSSVHIGTYAGSQNEDDTSYNVLIGETAGTWMQSGSDHNQIIGYNAGPSSLTYRDVGYSTLIGTAAGTGGDQYEVVAIGREAGYAGATGSVAIGAHALQSSNGNNNIGIGFEAGKFAGSGGGNIYIGPSTGPTYSQGQSDKLYIGSGSGQPLIKGDFADEEVDINATLKLKEMDPLPTGQLGMLSVSQSLLYFHNGTSWSAIS